MGLEWYWWIVVGVFVLPYGRHRCEDKARHKGKERGRCRRKKEAEQEEMSEKK